MRASWSVAAVAAAVATAALARPALAAAAATSSAPCYTAINGAVGLDSVTTIETPCATTLFDFTDNSGGRLVLRAYPPAAAYVVECRIKDDPGNSFSDNLFFTTTFIFQYLTGGNAKGANLTATSRTAPITLRPPVAGRAADEDWVGTMALAPSVWPPAEKLPPASTNPLVDVALFGGVTMAVIPKVLTAPPTEDDYRSAYTELEFSLDSNPLPGRWVINTTSPLSPSFSFFFTEQYNGSTWQIEAAAEVFHVSK